MHRLRIEKICRFESRNQKEEELTKYMKYEDY